MARKNRNRIIENLEIIDIADEGKSVAKQDNMVIFIDRAIPGDIVDVRITKKKKNYMEGLPVRFHQYSPERKEPFCEHFGLCGGCKWQPLEYSKQLAYKQKQVVDALTRLAKVEFPECKPILPSAKTTHYRNKLEFTCTNWRWLTTEEIEKAENESIERRGVGFHIPGQYDKVLNIHTCHLQADPTNQIRNLIRDFAIQHDWSFYNVKKFEGFLRNIIVRTATTGDLMVIVQFGEEQKEEINKLLDYLKEQIPQISSLMYVINTKKNDTFHDLEVQLHSGKPYITEEMEGLQFRVGPKSFYQTNSEQAYELYKVARDFAGLTGNETVYDLYTGTGTIAQFVARSAKKVIGVEYVPTAIEDAKKNAQLNQIENTEFFAGDMKDILTEEFITTHGQPDVIITDPPRAGMHPNVVETIIKTQAPRIVYVSCNPATQARDIALLKEHYQVKAVQPVDMFPHTAHVENVILLEKK
ncbi:23S rRNA (uracil(1939)-C(5))-methyltransferase RlmD [Rapidithrix thailandica]|uniref:23S rRNA (Uracil(1939)-C(5))-methyltransferase RlmD n=1 Tax=Rapidithrix thailandica TaxID=413964 RepID=A0AAW9S9Z3_9BACT